MNRWNVFCNENAPYRIYYRQIDIDGYEMYVMFPLPMTGMECGWAVSHGATTAATIQEAVQKFYPFMVEYWRSRNCRSWQLSVSGRRAVTNRFLVYA